MPNAERGTLEQERWHRFAIARLSADFISIEDAFSSNNKGFCLNGIYFQSVKDSFEHTLLVGTTGSGKSTKVFIPTIAGLDGSMVIHDPSKELLKITKSYLLEKGYHIEVLNFSEPYSSCRGSGYNPMLHIKESSDVYLLSDLLVRAGREVRPGDEHWFSRASELIATLIHLVLKMESTPTLSKVREQLLDTIADSDSVYQLFETHADDEFQRSFLALTKNKSNELSSIFSTAADALKDFANPNIADVTSRNDIDLSNLRSQKTALFIQNSTNRSHLYNKITSIFFEQLWLEMMEIPKEEDFDLFLLLDEFASLYLPTLPYKIDKVRKYRIGFLLAIQSLQQLKRAYGDNAITITDNCKTHIYLGAQKGDTALEIEKSLGKKGDEYRMPREKCRMLTNDISLILSNGKPPILTKNTPYFKNPDLNHLNEQATESQFHAANSETKNINEDIENSEDSFFSDDAEDNITEDSIFDDSGIENTVNDIYYM